ncbi:23S rRNA (adenine(2030)-N(6))-methyltransferase RlmJ [Paenibacillus prosopidis]|uniref:23S rRNA (Adenine2030-N6)-methyltransferase n=1 Tax=Paenibacillus prosopidis TaxID=630520 RepID=A0A368W4A3_9BACL|nr:23S rRNA (adenine(2030)-N(6))-methyltransferase RlmJ [Paenibacillus prosopidis]RCW50261.1 23S rRNA (adenine2030-N6)-methyltransferase [Paenibacillus prosopidis]
MPYSHYGEIGDVWKHLPLCFFLTEEKPTVNIESNSAYPIYRLNQTDERNYGVFHLFEQVSNSDRYVNIESSPYLQILKKIPGNQETLQTYLGSPGLALEILKDRGQFIFCDIEADPLQNIMDYVRQIHLDNRVKTVQGDSKDRLWHEIENMGKETFLHIDPYRIFEKNANDRCYFDLFIRAINRGIKTMLWYGYETLKEQKEMHAKMREALGNSDIELLGIDFYIEGICDSVVEVNPGVPGCGIMIANLSGPSFEKFKQYANELEAIYQNAWYQNKPARLKSVQVNLKG